MAFLGFEYRWVEFAEGPRRVAATVAYLQPDSARRQALVHLGAFVCAPRALRKSPGIFRSASEDLDRYDPKMRFADETVGAFVERLSRSGDPNSVVILTADHGEEFGEHGGHYHGTSVYEEQVHVPLIISAPGSLGTRRIAEPVQSIDLLPTLLDRARHPQAAAPAWARSGPAFGGKTRRRPGASCWPRRTRQTLLGQGSLAA